MDVDRFFAAKPGDPAMELPFDKAQTVYVGLFTEMLQQIHRNPDQSLIRTLRINNKDVLVVPCRRMKDVLPSRVAAAAQDRSIQLVQWPQLRLESREEAFIARADFTPSTSTAYFRDVEPTAYFSDADAQYDAMHTGFRNELASDPALPPPSVKDRSAAKKRRAARAARTGSGGMTEHLGYSPDVSVALQSDPSFSQSVNRILAADKTTSFKAQSGIQVTGAHIAWAYGVGVEVELLKASARSPYRIRLMETQRSGIAPTQGRSEVLRSPGSVLLCFEDGTGSVIAALPGYIASVTVEHARVISVSYVPSTNSRDWAEYLTNKSRLEQLRAVAATAARERSSCREPPAGSMLSTNAMWWLLALSIQNISL